MLHVSGAHILPFVVYLSFVDQWPQDQPERELASVRNTYSKSQFALQQWDAPHRVFQ
jgi:hypothetical protein